MAYSARLCPALLVLAFAAGSVVACSFDTSGLAADAGSQRKDGAVGKPDSRTDAATDAAKDGPATDHSNPIDQRLVDTSGIDRQGLDRVSLPDVPADVLNPPDLPMGIDAQPDLIIQPDLDVNVCNGVPNNTPLCVGNTTGYCFIDVFVPGRSCTGAETCMNGHCFNPGPDLCVNSGSCTGGEVCNLYVLSGAPVISVVEKCAPKRPANGGLLSSCTLDSDCDTGICTSGTCFYACAPGDSCGGGICKFGVVTVENTGVVISTCAP